MSVGGFIRRRWLRIFLVGLAGFLLIQLIPYGVDNPPARDEPSWDSPETRALAVRACFDCHSNETEVLWFENLAPVKWYVANHVREGRAALNFSEWSTRAGEEADDAAEAVEDGEMPPSSYTALGLHGDAELSPEEAAALIAGLERTIEADPPTGSDDHGGR